MSRNLMVCRINRHRGERECILCQCIVNRIFSYLHMKDECRAAGTCFTFSFTSRLKMDCVYYMAHLATVQCSNWETKIWLSLLPHDVTYRHCLMYFKMLMEKSMIVDCKVRIRKPWEFYTATSLNELIK